MPAGRKAAKTRRTGGWLPRAALFGGLCAGCYLGLLALYALLAVQLVLPAGPELAVGLGLAALCGAAAGFLCAKRAKQRFLLSGAACGAAALVPVCLALFLLGGAGAGLPLIAGLLLLAASVGGLAAARGSRRVRA